MTRDRLLEDVWGYESYPSHPHRRHPHREAAGQDRRQRLRAALHPHHPRRRLQVRRSDVMPEREPRVEELPPAPPRARRGRRPVVGRPRAAPRRRARPARAPRSATSTLARVAPDEALGSARRARGPTCCCSTAALPAAALTRGPRVRRPEPAPRDGPAVLVITARRPAHQRRGEPRRPRRRLRERRAGRAAVLAARVRGALRSRGCAGRAGAQERGARRASTRAAREPGQPHGRGAAPRRAASSAACCPPPLHHPASTSPASSFPCARSAATTTTSSPWARTGSPSPSGDVMGKGVPAALLAANLKAACAPSSRGRSGARRARGRVNRLFWEVTPKGLFASLFFGVFDLEQGVLEYVNAGHDHPFVVRPDGCVAGPRRRGHGAGLIEESALRGGRGSSSAADDLLVFFSDGVTDRANAHGELVRGGAAQGGRRAQPGAIAARIALYSLLGRGPGLLRGHASRRRHDADRARSRARPASSGLRARSPSREEALKSFEQLASLAARADTLDLLDL